MDLSSLSPETIFFFIIAGSVILIGVFGGVLAFITYRLDRAGKPAPGPAAEIGDSPELTQAKRGSIFRLNVIAFIALLTGFSVVISFLIEPSTRSIGYISLGIFTALIVGGLVLRIILKRLPDDTSEEPAPVVEEGHGRTNYVLVFIGLAGLTAIEIAVTFLPIPVAPILAALAIGKIVLVAMYYMHLKTDSQYFTWTILLPIPFVIMILMALLVSEFAFAG